MPRPGQIALVRIPQVDLAQGKLRPVLLVARCPGRYDDWLVAMVSSRIDQQTPDFDEVIALKTTISRRRA